MLYGNWTKIYDWPCLFFDTFFHNVLIQCNAINIHSLHLVVRSSKSAEMHWHFAGRAMSTVRVVAVVVEQVDQPNGRKVLNVHPGFQQSIDPSISSRPPPLELPTLHPQCRSQVGPSMHPTLYTVAPSAWMQHPPPPLSGTLCAWIALVGLLQLSPQCVWLQCNDEKVASLSRASIASPPWMLPCYINALSCTKMAMLPCHNAITYCLVPYCSYLRLSQDDLW